MSEGDRIHSPRSRWRLLDRGLVGLVVLLLVLAGTSFWLDLGSRLGVAAPDPVEDPAAVAPPAGLDLPEPVSAVAVAARLPRSGRDAGIDPAAVRGAIGRLGADKRLGPRVSVLVGDLAGRVAHEQGPGVVTPASTMKLLTSLAALESLGSEHRFTTAVALKGRTLTLVGGGDPLLATEQPAADSYPARADLATLAREAARTLTDEGRTRVRLRYDDTLFSGPSSSPDWEPSYLPDDVVSPITALWADQGREVLGEPSRSDDPAGDAAARFAALLRLRGIAVPGRPVPAPVPGGARELASVQSAELVEIVQHVLELSDNEGAEVLARHAALAEGEPGSFDGAGRALRSVALRLGVPMRDAVIHDGSGLSRGDRLRPRSLLSILALGADPAHPGLSGLVEGLPVAGFSGSLSYRFTNGAVPGLGAVRAKTGTLTGVHGLAGVVTGRDGSVMTYVAITDRVKVENTLFARDRLDQISAALAGCRCGSAG
jgi:D-alanyl-D-alanine carboxypeptidase/D-alanyl-D-alanine-endopeptidase (penicillin-binding protein 4)